MGPEVVQFGKRLRAVLEICFNTSSLVRQIRPDPCLDRPTQNGVYHLGRGTVEILNPKLCIAPKIGNLENVSQHVLRVGLTQEAHYLGSDSTRRILCASDYQTC